MYSFNCVRIMYAKSLYTKSSRNFFSKVRNVKHCFMCVYLSKHNCIPYYRFSTSSLLKFKYFIPAENMFAHSILEKHHEYSDTIYSADAPSKCNKLNFSNTECVFSLQNKNWVEESSQNVCQTFLKLSQNCSEHLRPITDPAFDELCSAIQNKCSTFSDEQLIKMLIGLSMWPETESINSRNFLTVWKALDEECAVRVPNWDVKTILIVADLFYANYLAGVSIAVKECLFKLSENVTTLSRTEFVQCLFYFNTSRSFPALANKTDFEESVCKHINKLSVDEMAIICMGFFKTETTINNADTIKFMLQKVSDNIDNIHEISLCAIAKFIHFSLPPSIEDYLYDFLTKCVSNVNRVSMLCCVHLAVLGTKYQMLHTDLINNICQRFVNDIKSLRLKDIERLALALGAFNYFPDVLLSVDEVILEELFLRLESEEFKRYGKSLYSCLAYLTIRGVSCEKLINRVLRSELILKTYGNKLDRVLLVLDVFAEVEFKQYKGSRLSSKTRGLIARTIPRQILGLTNDHFTATSKMLSEILQSCETTFGKENVAVCHILPQFSRADIVFGFDENLEPLPIPKYIKDMQNGSVKYAPRKNPHEKWYVLSAGGQNCYLRNTDMPVGNVASKIRQLKLVGYYPILVPWFDWICLPASQKTEYIRKLVLKDDIRKQCRS